MIFPSLAALAGLAVVAWSADQFVAGAVSVARHIGLSPLVIGMLIIGFGTSSPEFAVSVTAAIRDNPGVALGNAYGSNIANIALILGLTAVICPIVVQSRVLRKELPMLIAVTALAAWQLRDGSISRFDSVVLLVLFGALTLWTIWSARREKADILGEKFERNIGQKPMPIGRAIARLITGLLLLIIGSRALVWGAVEIAEGLGVSDLIIGLTIVAVGTSLPELAASIAAIRRKEDDIVLGNIIGSNLLNTLAVVGFAGFIRPMEAPPQVLNRDLLSMGILTCLLLITCYGFRGPGHINRFEGALFLILYLAYIIYLVNTISG